MLIGRAGVHEKSCGRRVTNDGRISRCHGPANSGRIAARRQNGQIDGLQQSENPRSAQADSFLRVRAGLPRLLRASHDLLGGNVPLAAQDSCGAGRRPRRTQLRAPGAERLHGVRGATSDLPAVRHHRKPAMPQRPPARGADSSPRREAGARVHGLDPAGIGLTEPSRQLADSGSLSLLP